MYVVSGNDLLWYTFLQLMIHLNFNDRTVRQWLLPAYNATRMSLYGLVLMVTNHLSATPLTDRLTKELQAYLIVDLCYNAVMRHDAINKLLEFWTHHIVYIVVLAYTVNGGYTGIVASYLLLEVPAAIRAWGTLVPAWRTDAGFGAAFFITRILLPFFIAARDWSQYPRVGAPLFLAMQAVHLYWFSLWVPRMLEAALGQRNE